jgi:uncharacterized phage-associated protein
MKTTDEILKIKATLLYILKSFPDGVDYIKLFKILYFAQQDHLVKYGRGIVRENFYALKHGPVPSYSYKALQVASGKKMVGDFEEFLNGINVKNDLVFSKLQPDMDELSGTDIKFLNASIEKHKDINPFDLSELSHDTAWEIACKRVEDDPEQNRMTVIDIARAGGASEKMIDYIRENQLITKYLLS